MNATQWHETRMCILDRRKKDWIERKIEKAIFHAYSRITDYAMVFGRVIAFESNDISVWTSEKYIV